jgi:hypothetical protein
LIPTPQGMNILMEPLNLFGVNTMHQIDVPYEHILFMDEPNLDILNSYNQKYGSGIVQATNLELNI